MEASSGMDGDMPMLKPGDASMASPFTAKAASVMPCTDILKQGRCTLVTTVQMFKILGLLCLSTAYSLSVMYLQGVKLGDVQVRAPCHVAWRCLHAWAGPHTGRQGENDDARTRCAY